MSDQELPLCDIGNGTDFATAWNELRSELLASPGWRMGKTLYWANGGGWGMQLQEVRRGGKSIYAWFPLPAPPAEAVREVTRLLHAERLAVAQ